MIAAVGIDIGGTKIETQSFDKHWRLADKCRVDTPADYGNLLATVVEQICRFDSGNGSRLPVGVSAAGIVNANTGLALTANLPASGFPFPADIEAGAGRAVTFVNDCRALTLSEATFGVAKGASPVVGLILGTGVGGGLAIDCRLVAGPSGVGGEFGHVAAPAHLVVKHELQIVRCGCGRMGCFETFIAGRGLSRLAKTVAGRDMSPTEIANLKSTDPGVARVWEVWCAIVSELLMMLTLAIDPEIIVVGGGLSNIAGIEDDLSAALDKAQFPGFSIPRVALAEGGDATGARGAAFAAWQMQQSGENR